MQLDPESPDSPSTARARRRRCLDTAVLTEADSTSSAMMGRDEFPVIGDVLKGKVVGFRNGDVVLAIGRGLLALMEKSYLVWLRRPGVGIKLKNGTELDVVVKVVGSSSTRGAPYILVGHLRTDERPWDRARRRHPIGRRERCKVVEFVPGGAIVAFESEFWAWLDETGLARVESKRAPDPVRRGDGFDVVVDHFDQEKRRIRVRHPMVRPGPDAAGEGAETASPDISGVDPDPGRDDA